METDSPIPELSPELDSGADAIAALHLDVKKLLKHVQHLAGVKSQPISSYPVTTVDAATGAVTVQSFDPPPSGPAPQSATTPETFVAATPTAPAPASPPTFDYTASYAPARGPDRRPAPPPPEPLPTPEPNPAIKKVANTTTPRTPDTSYVKATPPPPMPAPVSQPVATQPSPPSPEANAAAPSPKAGVTTAPALPRIDMPSGSGASASQASQAQQPQTQNQTTTQNQQGSSGSSSQDITSQLAQLESNQEQILAMLETILNGVPAVAA